MTRELPAKRSKLSDETRVKNELEASYIYGRGPHGKSFRTRASSERSRASLARNRLGNTFSPGDLRISVSGAVVRDNSIKVMLAAAKGWQEAGETKGGRTLVTFGRFPLRLAKCNI